MTKSKLRLTEIWKTEFIFQDIYDEASKEFKDYVDSLSDIELKEFIREKHKQKKRKNDLCNKSGKQERNKLKN